MHLFPITHAVPSVLHASHGFNFAWSDLRSGAVSGVWPLECVVRETMRELMSLQPGGCSTHLGAPMAAISMNSVNTVPTAGTLSGIQRRNGIVALGLASILLSLLHRAYPSPARVWKEMEQTMTAVIRHHHACAARGALAPCSEAAGEAGEEAGWRRWGGGGAGGGKQWGHWRRRGGSGRRRGRETE
jgi:hypothetical protein